MFFVVCSALISITAYFGIAIFPVPSRLGNVLAMECLSFAQVVLLTLVLSLFHQVSRIGFVIGHVTLILVMGSFWWQRGRPQLQFFSHTEILTGISQHKLLTIFLVIVLGMMIGHLVLTNRNLTFAGDGSLYHLPRSYFWIQHQNVGYFDTPVVIMNEYPPNASYYFMWGMLMRGDYGDEGLQTLQWLAGILTALVMVGLVRLAGHQRSSALFAGALILTLPMYLVQMGAIEVDLLTAFPGFAYVYFALFSLKQNKPMRNNYAIAYTGMAFGLFVGTKITAAFSLPAMGLAILIYALYRYKRDCWKPLVALVASCIIGFMLLGSYTYIQNTLDFGNPVTSIPLDQTTAGVEPDNPAYYAFWGNLVRYSYLVMDWGVLPADNKIAEAHQAMYEQVDQQLGLNLESVWKFSLSEYGAGRRPLTRTGYGLLGYSGLILMPLAMVWMSAWFWRSGDQRALFSILLMLVGGGWLVTFALLAPWDPYKMRHFPLVIPPLIAAIFPYIYARKMLAVPVMLVAILIGGDAVLNVFDRQQIQNDRYEHEYIANILKNTLPDANRIGFANGSLIYFVISDFQEPIYQFLPEDTFDESLVNGEVDAVLHHIYTGERDCPQQYASYAIYLPIFDYCVHVTDAPALLERLHNVYGFDNQAGLLMANQPEELLDIRDDYARLYLLTREYPVGEDVAIQLKFENLAPVSSIKCNNLPVDFQQKGDALTIYVLREQRLQDEFFQICDLQNVEAEAIGIQIGVDAPPAPEIAFDLQIDSTFKFAGFTMPDGYEFMRCGQVPVVTWWERLAEIDRQYSVSVRLVNDQGGVSQSDEVLALPHEALNTFSDRQFIPIPCDIEPGLYNIHLTVYDLGSRLSYPLVRPDGTSQGEVIHLTTIYVP